MKFTVQEIESAVVRAKNEAIETGISPELVDPVASTMAALELLGVGSNNEQVDLGSVIMELPETFGEWAGNYDLETHFDRFLAATVYLYEREGVQAVNTSDILRMYKKAHWNKPANAADVFAKSAERLLFTEVEEVDASENGQKVWSVTRTGYTHLHSLQKEDYDE
jgi:hypothetical protein